jgi:hypothetical protein
MCEVDNIKQSLYEKMLMMIRNDLTIGRIEMDLEPHTDEEINEFIRNNDNRIKKAIQNMINDYAQDNELDDLKDPPLDWLGEYLYDEC